MGDGSWVKLWLCVEMCEVVNKLIIAEGKIWKWFSVAMLRNMLDLVLFDAGLYKGKYFIFAMNLSVLSWHCTFLVMHHKTVWCLITVHSWRSQRPPTKVERGARLSLIMRRIRTLLCSRERETTGLMWVGMPLLKKLTM